MLCTRTLGFRFFYALLTLFFANVVFANTCHQFLSNSAYSGNLFLQRTHLEALNIFSNPLESHILSDPQLRVTAESIKNIRVNETILSDVLIEQVSNRAKVILSEREVFDLKYLVFDSPQVVSSVLNNIKGFESKPLGLEVLRAKEILENNPDSHVLVTDLGLSLWSKVELNRWLSDYAINSLTPQRMSEYIYRLAQENPRETQMPVAMAKRMAENLDQFKNFEIANREEMNLFNDGAEASSISFLYRSIYRRVLVEKRLDFLREMRAENPLLNLKGKAKEEALQTLAMFPEFMYQAEKISKTKFKLEAVLPEGGMVYSGSTKRINVNGQQFNVTLKALRFVDDVKTENLNMAIVISGVRGATVTAREVIRIKDYFSEVWLDQATKITLEHKLSRIDLEYNLELNYRETAQDLVVRMAPEIQQLGYEPYLIFGLFVDI